MPIIKIKGKSKDGLQAYRVRVNYTDDLGKHRRIERYAYGKAEAQLLEANLTRSVSDQDAQGRMKLSELCEEYINACRRDIRETTLDKRRRIFESTVLPTLGGTSLEKLTPSLLQKWKDGLGDELKISTRQNYYKELNGMLRFAFKRGYIKANPLDRVGNFRDTEFVPPRDRIRYYTPEEYSLYIKAVRKEAEDKGGDVAWGLYTFFQIAFWGGLRKGEINALRWSDIDDGRIINVRRSIAQKLKGEDRETAPKTKSSYRTVEASQALIDTLREQLERQKSNGAWSEDLRVCGGERCLRDTTIEKANERFAKAAGLRRITIHEFRHSHASMLANAGINIQEVARRLGHSDVKETWETYSHMYPDEATRATEALNAIVI